MGNFDQIFLWAYLIIPSFAALLPCSLWKPPGNDTPLALGDDIVHELTNDGIFIFSPPS